MGSRLSIARSQSRTYLAYTGPVALAVFAVDELSRERVDAVGTSVRGTNRLFIGVAVRIGSSRTDQRAVAAFDPVLARAGPVRVEASAATA